MKESTSIFSTICATDILINIFATESISTLIFNVAFVICILLWFIKNLKKEFKFIRIYTIASVTFISIGLSYISILPTQYTYNLLGFQISNSLISVATLLIINIVLFLLMYSISKDSVHKDIKNEINNMKENNSSFKTLFKYLLTINPKYDSDDNTVSLQNFKKYLTEKKKVETVQLGLERRAMNELKETIDLLVMHYIFFSYILFMIILFLTSIILMYISIDINIILISLFLLNIPILYFNSIWLVGRSTEERTLYNPYFSLSFTYICVIFIFVNYTGLQVFITLFILISIPISYEISKRLSNFVIKIVYDIGVNEFNSNTDKKDALTSLFESQGIDSNIKIKDFYNIDNINSVENIENEDVNFDNIDYKTHFGPYISKLVNSKNNLIDKLYMYLFN